MKCLSCETEVDPKWKSAIEKNTCPFCGNPILNEHLKGLLSNLSEIMIEMQPYQEELDDWLFSNYKYIKSNMKNDRLQRSSVNINGEEEKYIVSGAGDASVFFDRAEVISPKEKGTFKDAKDKTRKLKEAASNIREIMSKGNIEDTMLFSDDVQQEPSSYEDRNEELNHLESMLSTIKSPGEIPYLLTHNGNISQKDLIRLQKNVTKQYVPGTKFGK